MKTEINTIVSNGLIKYIEKMPEKISLKDLYESALQAAIESAPEFEDMIEVRDLIYQSICKYPDNCTNLNCDCKIKDGHYQISVDREVQVVRQYRFLNGIKGLWIDMKPDFTYPPMTEFRSVARLVEKKEEPVKEEKTMYDQAKEKGWPENKISHLKEEKPKKILIATSSNVSATVKELLKPEKSDNELKYYWVRGGRLSEWRIMQLNADDLKFWQEQEVEIDYNPIIRK